MNPSSLLVPSKARILNGVEDSRFDWLQSDQANQVLATIADWQHEGLPLTTQHKRIRRLVSADQAKWAMELAELRTRARGKFQLANQMLLTRVGLQQATDEAIARYKATRYPSDKKIHDFCCGIGGDLIGLGRRSAVHAVDCDPDSLACALHNATIYGLQRVTATCSRIESLDIPTDDCWHIDPDRRVEGRRATDPQRFSPDADFLIDWMRRNAKGAIKLAPASDAQSLIGLVDGLTSVETEFIGRAGECKQQMIWLGATCRQAGRRTVTVVDDDRITSESFLSPDATVYVEPVDSMPGYLFEPHPAVIAASLVEPLAERLNLRLLAPGHVLLAADEALSHHMLTIFQIVDHCALHRDKVQQMVQSHQVSRMEHKARGLPMGQRAERWNLQLCADGEPAVLFSTRRGRNAVAILCRRINETCDW